MSGILDSKSRVLDTIVTSLGRQQIADGKLNIRYVSFTDALTFYKADLVSGTQDATRRIYLESCNLPQDQITFEADDSGKIMPFGNATAFQVRAGQSYRFVSATGSYITSSNNIEFLSGEQFASAAGELLASSVDNFSKLQVIGSHDKLFHDDGFGIGQKEISFVISNDNPLKRDKTVSDLTSMDSLFNDVRFSNLPNFMFLPPINKIGDSVESKGPSTKIGQYKPLGRIQNVLLTDEQINSELDFYVKKGFQKIVTFEPTSRSNRLMLQFFEVSNDTMLKLDVIDYGYINNNRYFFVGKVLTDSNEVNTFVHLFTLVFK